MNTIRKADLLQKRRWRIRKKVTGTALRPRLAVRFTTKHIYAQAIDDDAGSTLVFLGTLDPELRKQKLAANLKGKVLDLALGYSHPILMDIPDGIKITVTEQTKVKVEGADKQLVGAVTAEIRSYYPPEPYKGKGVRIVGERVRRKEGKTVA